MQIQIDAPHFCAGYDMETGRIAPIIKYMKGWTIEQIEQHCKEKKWKLTKLNEKKTVDPYDYYCEG